MFSRSLAAAVVQRTCISCGVVFRRSAFPFERRLPRARALPRGRSAPSRLPLGAQTTRRNQSIAPPLHGPATHYHALAGRQCYPAWLAVPAKVLLPCRQCKRCFAPCQSVCFLLLGTCAVDGRRKRSEPEQKGRMVPAFFSVQRSHCGNRSHTVASGQMGIVRAVFAAVLLLLPLV